jgi:hypothetical protein
MAHFAKLNDNNEVLEVHVVNNDSLDLQNEEASGIAFLTEWSEGYTNWKQTSFNGNFRYNFAGVGYSYDPIDDAFIAPIPCEHQTLLLNVQKLWNCSECDAINAQIRLEQNVS